MKLWKIVLIVLGITLVILAFFMIVPVIVMDKSWWWFFAPFIFFIVAYIVAGLIILIVKIVTRKKPKEKKINITDTKLRAVYDMKYDLDNPDNLRIDKSILAKIGEKGAEKTPVLFIKGTGTEMNQTRIIIINLNNPKNEQSSLIDPTEDEIKDAMRMIADHPPEEIFETIKESMGQFGIPEKITTIRRPSSANEKKKEEEAVAEQKSAM